MEAGRPLSAKFVDITYLAVLFFYWYLDLKHFDLLFYILLFNLNRTMTTLLCGGTFSLEQLSPCFGHSLGCRASLSGNCIYDTKEVAKISACDQKIMFGFQNKL